VTRAVGVVVNPLAGRDIRRLVSEASVLPTQERVAVVRRVLRGLAATGADRVLYLPDVARINEAAVLGADLPLHCEPLPIRPQGTAMDSILAGRLLASDGAAAIVTLGGDGTNRAVARDCGDTPLVPVATGTNNVFSTMIDGTFAGLAAGLLATGVVGPAAVGQRTKRIEVSTAAGADFALIDAAVCLDRFAGARAIWDPGRITTLVLARAEPWVLGLSSIGGQLQCVGDGDSLGLFVELGPGPAVRAVLAPGLVLDVPIRNWRPLALGEDVWLEAGEGTVALDGERELTAPGRVRARVCRSGPLVVDVRAVLARDGPGRDSAGGTRPG